ncbi:TPA: hypothetical protein H1005_02450 [archaeon]|nr:hypothetical protein [Candidatus Naiadarchaeales archaeon SRR2090153.bin1042]
MKLGGIQVIFRDTPIAIKNEKELKDALLETGVVNNEGDVNSCLYHIDRTGKASLDWDEDRRKKSIIITKRFYATGERYAIEYRGDWWIDAMSKTLI